MYKLTNSPSITRIADGASIPADRANIDFANYLQWLTESNIPEPADVPSLDSFKAAALTEVRALRAGLFPTLAGLQSEALARGNDADALAIATVQQGCRDITATDLTACTTKDEIDAAFLNAWLVIVGNAPTSVKVAFAGLKK